MKNTLAFKLQPEIKPNLGALLSLRAPCKGKTSELWSFEGEEALKKKLEGMMQMREMSLGKLEELSDVVMKGCQWRW